MTGLLWTGGILAVIATYLRMGFKYARRNAARNLTEARACIWSTDYLGNPKDSSHIRNHVMGLTLRDIVLWFILRPLDGIYEAAEANDPDALKKRIRDLEREVGLR